MKKVNLLSRDEMKKVKGGIISTAVLEELCNYWSLGTVQTDPNLSPEIRAIVDNMTMDLISQECARWAHAADPE